MTYDIFPRLSFNLYQFFKIMIGPTPSALSKQFVVDIGAINGLETFPLAINIAQHPYELFGHAVFSSVLFDFFYTGFQ